MQRIHPIEANQAPTKTKELLAAVKKQLGTVPNLMATMAQSSAALESYLNFNATLSGGLLSPKLREQIALAVAGANQCDYCASAHTVLGGMVGLSADELADNLAGKSSDARAAGALVFAQRVVDTRGNVSDADLAEVRLAGYSDGEVVEIVANTVLNIFTNYFNHVARTEIDFPVVSAREQAVSAG